MAVKTKAVPFSDLYPSFRKGFIEPALKILNDRRMLAMKKAKPVAAETKTKPASAPIGGKKGGKSKSAA